METTKKKYKIFPWWLIMLLIITTLQTVNSIGRYGFDNSNINWIVVAGITIIIIYRSFRKEDEDNIDNNNVGGESEL